MEKETLTVYTDKDGTIRYFNVDGQLHHQNGPAIIDADGDKFYYINGQLHNANGPAVIYADGGKDYYINGERHNPHGPAIVDTDGSKAYYINDKELSEAEFTAWQTQQAAK
jgi:hypothetical protein